MISQAAPLPLEHPPITTTADRKQEVTMQGTFFFLGWLVS